MPTNEERREVAKKMRDIVGYSSRVIIEKIQETCGCNTGLVWEDVMEFKNRLADFIEPKPERICKIESFDNGLDEDYDGSLYSYAPPTYYLSCGHEAYYLKPNYCPDCGAKVK